MSMLKKTITYQNFDGKQVTETLYFNLTKAELVEWEMLTNEGLTDYFIRISGSNDKPTLIRAFKELLLKTYGEKSDDGRHFMKSDEIRAKFENSAAYDSFFMEFFTDESAAVAFIRGVMPEDLINEEAVAAAMQTGDQRLQAARDQLSPPPPPMNIPNPAGM